MPTKRRSPHFLSIIIGLDRRSADKRSQIDSGRLLI